MVILCDFRDEPHHVALAAVERATVVNLGDFLVGMAVGWCWAIACFLAFSAIVVWGWIVIHGAVLAAVLLGSGTQATPEHSDPTRRSEAQK